MNRRDFFRRAAIVAAGVVAADQLELLERLTHRKVFALGAPQASDYCIQERFVYRPLTLTDWQKQYDSDGRLASIVELLNQSNVLLDDLRWLPA